MKAEKAVRNLPIGPDSKSAAIEILSNIDESVVREWAESVKIKNGGVAGFNYRHVKDLLPYDAYLDLCEALGFARDRVETLENYDCWDIGCYYTRDRICNPDRCPYGHLNETDG